MPKPGKRVTLFVEVISDSRQTHQSPEFQPRQFCDRSSKLRRCVRHDARLAVLGINIHFNAHIEVGEVGRSLIREATGDFQAVNRMDPLKMLSDRASFVGLQMADKMPGQVVTASGIDLFQPLLNEIFAEIPLTRAGSLQDRRNRLLLTDRQEPYMVRRSLRICRSFR